MKLGYFIVLILFLAACNNTDYDCETTDYSGCDTQMPEYGTMTVNLTIRDEQPNVPVFIFKGKFEDDYVIWSDTVSEESFDVDLPVDQYYTVIAEYYNPDKTIVAMDGDNIKKRSQTMCDSTCWSVKNASVNVKLK